MDYGKLPKKENKILRVLGTIFILYIIVSLLSTLFIGVYDLGFALGNVALIEINDVLTTSGREQSLFSQRAPSSSDYSRIIMDAADKSSIKAIVLKINSPGGSAVASKEIVDAVKYAKQKKPVVAYIRETGASGAYWVAAASDYVIAYELSITGSVGVLASYLQFSELLETYGIRYVRLTGGEYKDIGSPFRNLTDEEEILLQKKIDSIHDVFFDDVYESRNLSGLDNEKLRMVKSGIFFTAREALEHNLVDEIGNFERVEEFIMETYGLKEVNYAVYLRQRTGLGLGLFYRESVQMLGESIGASLSKAFAREEPLIRT